MNKTKVWSIVADYTIRWYGDDPILARVLINRDNDTGQGWYFPTTTLNKELYPDSGVVSNASRNRVECLLKSDKVRFRYHLLHGVSGHLGTEYPTVSLAFDVADQPKENSLI